jgi:hypothetical protein
LENLAKELLNNTKKGCLYNREAYGHTHLIQLSVVALLNPSCEDLIELDFGVQKLLSPIDLFTGSIVDTIT